MKRLFGDWFTRFSAGIACLAIAGFLLAQEEVDARVKQVLADWKKRRAYPPVQYEVQGTVFSTKASIDSYLKAAKLRVEYEPKDHESIWNVRMLLDVQGQRHRFEQVVDYFRIDSGKKTRHVRVTTFDGTKAMGRDRRVVDGQEVKETPDSADVWILTGNLLPLAFTGQLVPLFASHGVVRFPPQGDVTPGKLALEPDTSQMTVHGFDVLESRRCLVLRSYPRGESFQEYWIDTARDSALLRWLTYSRSFPVWEMNIRYQQQESCWLVSGWTYDHRLWYPEKKESRTSEVYHFKVVKAAFEPNPSDDSFRLPLEPGMLVSESHNDPDKNPLKEGQAGKEKLYRVEPTGDSTQVIFEKGVERRRARFDPWWFAAVLLVAALVTYGLFRWHKQRRDTAPKQPT